MRGTWGVSQEDSRSAQPMSRHIEEWAERRMRNISETYVTKVDSNASLQKRDSEHYGPHLEEGGSYQTRRGPLRMWRRHAKRWVFIQQ